MGKFNFRLDSVLKLREFKEQQVMNEIAEVVQAIEETKQEIAGIHTAIDQGYSSQESLVDSSATGNNYAFYPYFFKGKKEHLQQSEAKLSALEKRYQRKIEEYNVAKGEVKVIQGLKDKALLKHKKEMDKKIEANREEFVIMQMKRKKMGF